MKSIPLGKARFRVRVVKDARRHRIRAGLADEGPIHGYVNLAKKVIVIEEGEPEVMASTLLGEAFHVLFPYIDDFQVHEGEDRLFPTLWRYGFRPF